MLKTFEPLAGHSEIPTLIFARRTIGTLYRLAAKAISSISTHHISHRARPRPSPTTPGGFSERDQNELAEEFEKLVDRGSTVLLSNSETPLTTRLYGEFRVRSMIVNRPINSVGSGRTGYKELI